MATTPVSEVLYNITPSTALNTTNVFIYTSEYNNLKALRDFLALYFIWIIFAFGFPGNLISFCVIIRISRDRLTSSFFFVALLALVDNFVIVLKIIENQTRINQVEMTATSCKFLYFFGLTMTAYSNWILILISAERFTAIRFQKCWSLKWAAITSFAVWVFLGLVHVHIFFTITTRNFYCRVAPTYLSFYIPWWFLISSSVYAIVPAIALTIFNTLIILLLRRSSTEPRHQERQVTVMLVTLAVVFIILTIPRCVFVVMYNYWKPSDHLARMRKSFIDILTMNMGDSNHAVNFYLYFVAGQYFRKLCFSLFKSCSRRNHDAGGRNHDVLSENTKTSDVHHLDTAL